MDQIRDPVQTKQKGTELFRTRVRKKEGGWEREKERTKERKEGKDGCQEMTVQHTLSYVPIP